VDDEGRWTKPANASARKVVTQLMEYGEAEVHAIHGDAVLTRYDSKAYLGSTVEHEDDGVRGLTVAQHALVAEALART
jgi:hypothetical protein